MHLDSNFTTVLCKSFTYLLTYLLTYNFDMYFENGILTVRFAWNFLIRITYKMFLFFLLLHWYLDVCSVTVSLELSC